MERLTKLAKNGNKYVSAIGSGHGCWGRIMNRLAAYEDTGLTPEEVRELVHDTYGPLHKKLGEWIKAESEGRLSVCPCKIGDDIWWIDDEAPFVKCDKGGVTGIVATADGFMITDRSGELYSIGTRYCYLSKEAAEKALETGAY